METTWDSYPYRETGLSAFGTGYYGELQRLMIELDNLGDDIPLEKLHEHIPPPVTQYLNQTLSELHLSLPPSSTTVNRSELKQLWSCVSQNITLFNHGSYGACPIIVKKAHAKWIEEMEDQPCKFFNTWLLSLVGYTVALLGRYIRAPSLHNLVLIPNTTTGCNAILSTFPFEDGDSIICLNVAYVKNAINFYSGKKKVKVIEIPVRFPFNKEDVIQAVTNSIEPSTKLALIDHIVSSTALVVPLEEIVEICHKRNVKVLVDGAHVIGQLPLDFKDWESRNCLPDFYISNCHKWLCSSSGSAFLYIKDLEDSKIWFAPPIISHGYTTNNLSSQFAWLGTNDYTSYLTIITAILFFNRLDLTKVINSNHEMMLWGINYLKDLWKIGDSDTFEITNPDMTASMMLIQFPKFVESKYSPSTDASVALSAKLWKDYKIEAMCMYRKMESGEDKLVVRLSVPLYIDKEDFIKFGNAILEICK